jgi:hypothetical protein
MGESKHTMFASKAVGLAEMFNYAMAKHRLDGPVGYVAQLSAPDGPSTEGGKQALQHVKLVPEGGGPTLVIGSAHLVEQTAELRTYAAVDDMHRQRFKGSPFQADQGAYDALLDRIRAFFDDREFRVSTAEVAPRPSPGVTGTRPAPHVATSHAAAGAAAPRSAAVATAGGSRATIVLAAVAAAVALGVVGLFLRG